MSTAIDKQLVDQYLSTSSGTTLQPSTVKTYRGVLEQYLEILSDTGTSVLEADHTDAISFIEQQVRNGNRESTLQVKLAVIEQLYRYIRLRTEFSDQVTMDILKLGEIELSKYNTPPPVEREALSREEVRRLFDAMKCFRNRLLAVTATETGLRNSDLRELRIDDIDFSDRELHVRDPKGSRPYDVPISGDLAFELNWWLDNHRPSYNSSSRSPYVFPGRNGPKLETNGSLCRIVRDAAKRAGLQEVIGTIKTPDGGPRPPEEQIEKDVHRVTPHTLRHTYLTMLNDAGVSLSIRQLVANHQSAETTRGYTHGKEGAFDRIRDRFDPPR